MDNKQMSMHTNAMNLARRWSIQNENDLMQENLYENTLDEGKSPTHTHDTCKELASHLIHFKSLPMECRKFTDVVVDLKRRDSDSTDPTQVLS